MGRARAGVEHVAVTEGGAEEREGGEAAHVLLRKDADYGKQNANLSTVRSAPLQYLYRPVDLG